MTNIILIIQAIAIILLAHSLFKLGAVVNSQGMMLHSRASRQDIIGILRRIEKIDERT